MHIAVVADVFQLASQFKEGLMYETGRRLF